MKADLFRCSFFGIVIKIPTYIHVCPGIIFAVTFTHLLVLYNKRAWINILVDLLLKETHYYSLQISVHSCQKAQTRSF